MTHKETKWILPFNHLTTSSKLHPVLSIRVGGAYSALWQHGWLLTSSAVCTTAKFRLWLESSWCTSINSSNCIIQVPKSQARGARLWFWESLKSTCAAGGLPAVPSAGRQGSCTAAPVSWTVSMASLSCGLLEELCYYKPAALVEQVYNLLNKIIQKRKIWTPHMLWDSKLSDSKPVKNQSRQKWHKPPNSPWILKS